MFWGQALIEFRRTNKARSWPNFRAWHLKADSKSAFATSLGGSQSPPLTTSFGISAFDMSRGTHPPTLPMSSRMHHFPNRRPPDHRIAHTYWPEQARLFLENLAHHWHTGLPRSPAKQLFLTDSQSVHLLRICAAAVLVPLSISIWIADHPWVGPHK